MCNVSFKGLQILFSCKDDLKMTLQLKKKNSEHVYCGEHKCLEMQYIQAPIITSTSCTVSLCVLSVRKTYPFNDFTTWMHLLKVCSGLCCQLVQLYFNGRMSDGQ